MEDWRVGDVGSEVVGEVTVLGEVKACRGGLADIELYMKVSLDEVINETVLTNR